MIRLWPIQTTSVALQYHHLKAVAIIEPSQLGYRASVRLISKLIVLENLPYPLLLLFRVHILFARKTPITNKNVQAIQQYSRKPLPLCKTLQLLPVHLFRQ